MSWIETLGTFAAAFAALERYHHEEDVIGSRCGRDFGRFRSLAGLCWSAHLSRTRRLSVLVGLYRCPGWRADPPLLLAYPALLGRLCLARAPRAYLRLIRSRLSVCDSNSAVMINRLSVLVPGAAEMWCCSKSAAIRDRATLARTHSGRRLVDLLRTLPQKGISRPLGVDLKH